MKYSIQTRRFETDVLFACIDYFRHEAHPSGLLVSHLGSTAIIGDDPEFGMLSTWHVDELKRLASEACVFDPNRLGEETDLEALAENSLVAWQQLLGDAQALRAKTVLVEIRTPGEQTPSGLIVPGGHGAALSNEPIGFIAAEAEIAVIEGVSHYVQSLNAR